MTSKPSWQDPVGLETINTIVKKIVPTWPNGLHPVQLELVSGILDGTDILCCTATGDGKSAAFAIPCLVLSEYNKHLDEYPAGLPTRAMPVGVVITPTKGLASNIVNELSTLNVSAFSYCKETLTEARKTGVYLAKEISECIRWQVICVDPEHLRDKEWREITESPTFRSNILFACVDEVHLINSWGLSFREAFTLIGTFLRGRFPLSVSVVGLSATLEPGLSTASVCKSLGFFEGTFKLIRRSNERPNTHFSIKFVAHGMNGDQFPYLLPYLASGRKTVIHCQTVNQVTDVHAYIWRVQPAGSNKLIRARVYHSICPPDYNAETIELIKHDPRCQIIIATVAFSNGLNAATLLDSLSLGLATTFDESWQEKGRVGRDPKTTGRGVIFAHRSIIKVAETFLATFTSPSLQTNKSSRKKIKAPRILDKSKALVITEKSCYVACINICYGNPSLDPSRPDSARMDCLAARRRLPCSLCLSRQGGTITFPPSENSSLLPPLSPIQEAPVQKPSKQKKNKLSKDERLRAENHLREFGASIRQLEKNSNDKSRPRSSYFPPHLLSIILDQLLTILFPAHLQDVLDGSWIHYPTHGTALYDSIIQIQISIITQRKSRHRNTSGKQCNKQPQVEDPMEEETDRSLSPDSGPELVDHSSTRKRPAMNDVTNTSKRRRAPRAPQPSVAQVSEQFGPRYRTRQRAVVTETSSTGRKENETPTIRSSLRLRH